MFYILYTVYGHLSYYHIVCVCVAIVYEYLGSVSICFLCVEYDNNVRTVRGTVGGVVWFVTHHHNVSPVAIICVSDVWGVGLLHLHYLAFIFIASTNRGWEGTNNLKYTILVRSIYNHIIERCGIVYIHKWHILVYVVL